MFFQLSLPSTPTGTDTGDEPAGIEPQGPGTLTLPAVRVAGTPGTRPVARIRLSARGTKGSLRVGVAAPSQAITYTAERSSAPGPELPLQ
ncbi:MAG: hypothetical protein ACXWC2_09780 [Ramlibacter sp.]